jgi:hypothetical protein
VPANPFSEVSDSAIEYFVEWSVLQSTEAHPQAHPIKSSFADVPMAAAIAEPQAEAQARRVRLFGGIGIGMLLGIPLGAALMWLFGIPVTPEPTRPMSELKVPMPAKQAPPSEAKEPAEAAPAAEAKLEPAAAEPAKELAKAEPAKEPAKEPKAVAKVEPAKEPAKEPKAAAKTEPAAAKAEPAVAKAEPAAAKENAKAEPANEPEAKVGERPPLERPLHGAPTAPPEAAELPAPPSLGAGAHKPHMAVLRVKSTPSGAEVSVRGESRGPTPVDVELAPNHRYDVVVTLPGHPPWKKRINLKPPTTEVVAKF